MHPSGYNLMERLLAAVSPPPPAGALVLDVGSLDVNGSLRPIFESRGHVYQGLDMVAGKNVDIVCNAISMAYVLGENKFDLVVSSNCLEHCDDPVAVGRNIRKVLKVGGWALLTAPFQIQVHRYPVDCWRVLPDGMRCILTGFDEVKTDFDHGDIIETWGMGRKVG